MFMLLLLSECSKVHLLGQDVLILKYPIMRTGDNGAKDEPAETF
jgi:hypothetical protein